MIKDDKRRIKKKIYYLFIHFEHVNSNDKKEKMQKEKTNSSKQGKKEVGRNTSLSSPTLGSNIFVILRLN